MLYTTYFGKIKDLPKNVIPVCIAGRPPIGFDILHYKQLAPTYKIFAEWRVSKNTETYIQKFERDVLGKLNADVVVADLKHLTDHIICEEVDIALVCYEKSTDFCHRHLVAKWLNENGYPCREYEYERSE